MSDATSGDGFQQCHCTLVTRTQVLAAIAGGCRSVDDLRRNTGACGGCGSCRPELEDLLRQVACSSSERAKADPST